MAPELRPLKCFNRGPEKLRMTQTTVQMSRHRAQPLSDLDQIYRKSLAEVGLSWPRECRDLSWSVTPLTRALAAACISLQQRYCNCRYDIWVR